MELRIPEESWQGDLGRVLPPEEVEVVKDSITPIGEIISKVCRVEATNDKWRLGRV